MPEHLLTISNIFQSAGLKETTMLISQAIFPLLNLLLIYKTICFKKKRLIYNICSVSLLDLKAGGEDRKLRQILTTSKVLPCVITSWFFNSHFSSTQCKRLTFIKLQQCIVHELQAPLLFKSLPLTRKQGQGGERTVKHSTTWFNDSI